MNILISNDDGYQAEGIHVLAKALASVSNIHVVAPNVDKSGASNSLTLEYPLRARTTNNGFIRVDGTPTDCVHLALTGLLDSEPDMVVAGINSGPNLGDDVIYSGTVAAATEGRHLGYPALAVSMASHDPKYYETGARVVLDILQRLTREPLPEDSILNINVPDVEYENLAGIMATRLGHRHKAEPVVKDVDPRGDPIYWVGPPGKEQDAGDGTDFYAVKNNYVSITPLQVDLTKHQSMAGLEQWLEK